jgi:hypothetical protein
MPELVEHRVETMLMQRIVGIALGYEDLVDHDELRLSMPTELSSELPK